MWYVYNIKYNTHFVLIDFFGLFVKILTFSSPVLASLIIWCSSVITCFVSNFSYADVATVANLEFKSILS